MVRKKRPKALFRVGDMVLIGTRKATICDRNYSRAHGWIYWVGMGPVWTSESAMTPIGALDRLAEI